MTAFRKGGHLMQKAKTARGRLTYGQDQALHVTCKLAWAILLAASTLTRIRATRPAASQTVVPEMARIGETSGLDPCQLNPRRAHVASP